MAYDATSKRVYIDTSVTPNVGVSIADVKTALFEGSDDLGILCTSQFINPMAKYKPVEQPSILGMTGRTSGSGYWRGADGQCGLSIPKALMYNRFDFVSGATAWGFAPPTTWFRLLDFDGYDASEKVSLADAKLPVGYLTEGAQSQITFQNGILVFHVTLNQQDTTGYFLTLNDLSVMFGSTAVPLTDLYPRLLIKSTDGTINLELESDAVKRSTEHGADPEETEPLTLGEIVDSGATQITFAPPFTFYIEAQAGADKTVYGGDIYTDGSNQYVIVGANYSDNRYTMSEVTCYRKGTAYTVPQSGTLTKVSGSGSSTIQYFNYNTTKLTTGSKQFRILPILTDNSYVCGIGHAAKLMAIASVTDTLVFSIDSVAWSKSGSTITYTAVCTFMNGYNATKYVDVLLATDGALSWQELEPDLSNPTTERSNIALAALKTTSVTITGTVSANTYTGVAVGYRNNGESGYRDSEEYYYDDNGNRVTPPTE